jgi:hypothetical protein
MTDGPGDSVREPLGLDETMADSVDSADDTVVYDVSEWTPDQIDTLEWALGRDGISSVLRDAELTIRSDDESRVDYLIDHLFDEVENLELEPVDDDGDADINEMEALGDLFVAADRLARAPGDEVLQAEFDEAAAAMDGLPLPFGFERPVWDRIQMLAGEVVEALDAAEDDVIAQRVGALRDLVRQYV